VSVIVLASLFAAWRYLSAIDASPRE
jgi:hypothetical protein